MFKVILSSIIFASVSTLAHATQPTGKITEISFFGSGVNEVVFVTIEPKSSACPYAGKFVMPSQGRPGITAALLAAFQAQNTVTIYGTGQCHASWSNYEVLNYSSFSK